MTEVERENWLVNIENVASHISSEIGFETVKFVFGKYGACSIEKIADSDLPEVFSELFAIEVELRQD